MKRISVFITLLLILSMFSACGGISQPQSNSINDEMQSRLDELEKQNSELKKQLEEKENEARKVQSEAENKLDEQSLKDNQLAVILSTKIIEQDTQYKSLYPDMVQWIIENKSDNVIKNYTVSILGYDNNGYPIKVTGQIDYSSGFEKLVLGEAVNIQPSETHGEGYGYKLSQNHQLAYALVLVSELEFYDRDKWENPYYSIWLEKYKEKPVSVDELKSMSTNVIAENTPIADSSTSADSTSTIQTQNNTQSTEQQKSSQSQSKSSQYYEEEIKMIEDIANSQSSDNSTSTLTPDLALELAQRDYQESYQN